MKRRTAWVIGGSVMLILLGMQVIPVNRTNPPVEEDLQAPAKVKAILRNSCYDCHSNETRWPWYSRVAPASWFLADHTKEGRERLNFSTWNLYSPEERKEAVEEALEEIRSGGMPLTSYTLIHRSAKLSTEDRATLESWAASYKP